MVSHRDLPLKNTLQSYKRRNWQRCIKYCEFWVLLCVCWLLSWNV